jgi:hypothetical protein
MAYYVGRLAMEPPILAPADSPPSGGWLTPLFLFSGSAVAEKGGREDFHSPNPKIPLQVIIVVNIKWIINKDADQRL